MKDQTEVCPLSREVMSPVSSTPIQPITGRRSLPPSSSTRSPIGGPYGPLSLMGGLRAYQVPLASHRWGRRPLSTDGVGCPCHRTRDPLNPPRSEVVRIVPSGLVNGVYQEFACARLTIYPSPAPRRCSERRWVLAVSASAWLWVRCERAIDRSLPSCLTS